MISSLQSQWTLYIACTFKKLLISDIEEFRLVGQLSLCEKNTMPTVHIVYQKIIVHISSVIRYIHVYIQCGIHADEQIYIIFLL